MPELGKAYVQIIPSAEGISGAISRVLDPEADSAGKTSGASFITSFKALALKAIAGLGIGKAISMSLNEGGQLEQSIGGVETLFKDAADQVKGYASQAFKTAGLSANEYMQEVTGFSAALVKSLGGDTKAAAEAANLALTDMSDNANKMGTDMESITRAYQGFAKQQYTMLDNLKLGYGGTKTEMQRLLADATKLTGVKYDINNLADVYQAIHVIQDELGITGTTAKEASQTLQGSAAAMKAAFKDLLGNLAIGEPIEANLQAVSKTFATWLFGNLIPMVGNMAAQIPTLIGGIFTTALPIILEQAQGFLAGLGEFFTVQLPEAIVQGAQLIAEQLPVWIQTGMDVIGGLVLGAVTAVPELLATFADAGAQAVAALATVDWLGLGMDVIDRIVEGARTLIDIFPTLLRQIGSTAFDWLRSINWLQLGKDVITFVFDGVQALFSLVPDLMRSIGQTAEMLFHDIDWWGLGTAVINFLRDSITWLFDVIPDLLLDIGTTAWDAVREIDWLGLGSDVIHFIADGIGWLFTTIPDALLDIGTAAWDAFIGVDWLGLGVDVISTISGGIDSVFTMITTALGDIAQEGWNAFIRLDWVQLGVDTIAGIVQGFRNAAGSVSSFLMQMAKDALRSVKNFFKIGSPSKLMEDEVGRWIPPGVAVGIERSEDSVTDAMDELVTQAVKVPVNLDTAGAGIAAAVKPGAWSYGSPSGGERPVINITINAAETDTAEDIADRVMDRLTAALEREERAYGTI
jgi:phage-related protein